MQRDRPHLSGLAQRAAGVRTLPELAALLRELRRRHARQLGGTRLTYRDIAAITGWSHGIIGEYLSGRVLPPADRFDTLIALLGAGAAEQGALATARDRVEEDRRPVSSPGRRVRGAAHDCAAGRLVPRQLPMDVREFTGRADQLADLDALLDRQRQRPAVLISAVAGTAGVGKTEPGANTLNRYQTTSPAPPVWSFLG